MKQNMESTVAHVFLDIAQALETGQCGARPKLAVTAIGSEHGEENVMAAAKQAQQNGVDVVFIGSISDDSVECVYAADEKAAHEAMESLLASKSIDGAVTMHYPFPIGVSTVGRCVTPGKGKPMYLATTTGTSSTDRISAMILNAIYGIITAKACGNPHPTVGIANIDGARQTETALRKLQANGYDLTFAESGRADGGAVMRGNDLLTGSPDIMVMDSLTGNLMAKIFSAFTSGGSFETVGWGYGPGIGDGYEDLVMIISRASGAPVIANALSYGAEMVRGNYREIAAAEFAAAKKAGLSDILRERAEASSSAKAAPAAAVTAPPKEVVGEAIPGVEVMDLEDAVQVLWGAGIYAESGMGCTGPVILISAANLEKGKAILKEHGYIGD